MLFSNVVNLNKVFDELILLNKMHNLRMQDETLPGSEKWAFTLGKTSQLPNISKIIFLSMSCTSVTCENKFQY